MQRTRASARNDSLVPRGLDQEADSLPLFKWAIVEAYSKIDALRSLGEMRPLVL